MGSFIYKAVDKNGVVVKGSAKGENAAQVRHDLDLSGLIAIDVKKANIFNTEISDIGIFAATRKKLSKNGIAFACRQLAFVLKSGLSMDTGLNVIIDNAPNRAMKKCFLAMKSDILRGESVSECFRKSEVFPVFLCSMIHLGEQTDSLDTVMKNMADFYEKDARVSAQIAASMIYPVFVAVAMVIVVIGALIFVVPGFSQAFIEASAVLPLPTRILIGMSNLLTRYWGFCLIFLAIISGALIGFLTTSTGQRVLDIVRLKNFITGDFNTKSINLYFAASMSVLLSSKTDMIASLETAKEILGSVIFNEKIDRMIGMIRSGTKLSDASDGFCGMLQSMIALGEETDKLPETFDQCAKYLEEELNLAVNRLKSLIQPVSTIILGMVLAFIVLATMLPTIQMTSFY